ncbi:MULTISPECIES: hypothetical protein [unclassified Flavobacterium]|uniref:hypothetical protein n=1 Tax=unclassified Flavobacterium TaxID=196869 RepID=UPI001F1318CE|nr:MULTISPECIES: hypothetical protein [unclassified Flavobacterium]UMY66466.1 hypothetical protein MKO97_03535 [Flavobacterium sp. HJ-32-4]
MDKLVEKVRKYLDDNNIHYMENSVTFAGHRRDAPQIDGTKRDVYIVTYQVENNKDDPFGYSLYFVNVDYKTRRLLSILGPQSFEVL